MNKCTLFVALFFFTAAVALYLAAILTNFWVSVGDLNYGLLRICNSTSGCEFVDWNVQEYPHIVTPRIIMVVAGGIAAVAFAIGFIGVVSKTGGPIVAEGVLYIVVGILIFGACGTFTALTSENISLTPISFAYSFYLGWASGLAFVSSGISTVVLGNSLMENFKV